ncbi:hypothetical protein Tco_0765427 [Tanacetum coccineum]
MGDANPIRTLEDYSRPSHEGYRNTIELPEGNNMVPLRSDTIRLVQNGCSFYGLRSEDPNQHLKDFLKLGSISTWEDLPTHFLAQFFPPGKTAKLRKDILINAKESWALLEDIDLYDNESWNNPRDFAKPLKAISLPQDVPSTSDRCLIELKNQVQRLMEAHLVPKQPIQVKKITSSCEICSGPHDSQYCMENPKQAFVEYASSRIDEAGGLVSNFMASQDARLFKFEADFKLQQSEMTNKIDTVLKAITGRMAGALPNDTEGNTESINTIELEEGPKNRPQLEPKDPAATKKIGSIGYDEEKEVEWKDAEENLDLIDTSEESVYESLIKEMPRCSLNYDFRIRKGDPRNLKIPCMIGHKFMANAYIDVDLPMNIMSLAYYNSIRKDVYEYRGRNFIGL